MSAKPKRPTVLDLGSLLVSKPPEPAAEEYQRISPPTPPKAASASFRTSVFFSRAVHDKLRTIAFEERKTVTDLIHEGLDAVLQARNYPSTKELRDDAEYRT
jgi:hypothetical protein